MSLTKWAESPNISLSGDQLTLTTLTTLGAARATNGKSADKWYFELTLLAGGHVGFGIEDGSMPLNTHGPTSGTFSQMLYSSTGEKAGPVSSSYGDEYGIGDVIGVAVDLIGNTVEFFKNGISQGIAFNNLNLMSKPIYPRMVSWASGVGKVVEANFGGVELDFSDVGQLLSLEVIEKVGE